MPAFDTRAASLPKNVATAATPKSNGESSCARMMVEGSVTSSTK